MDVSFILLELACTKVVNYYKNYSFRSILSKEYNITRYTSKVHLEEAHRNRLDASLNRDEFGEELSIIMRRKCTCLPDHRANAFTDILVIRRCKDEVEVVVTYNKMRTTIYVTLVFISLRQGSRYTSIYFIYL